MTNEIEISDEYYHVLYLPSVALNSWTLVVYVAQDNRNCIIRNLQKTAGGSKYIISLPIEVVREL